MKKDALLSLELKSQINFNGIYVCDPVTNWLPSYKRNDPYHCINWTFRAEERGEDVYMVDTYWATDAFRVKLTDENFSMFKLLYDRNEVTQISLSEVPDYDDEDIFHVALDSGGYQYSKYYFKKIGAKKNKEKVLDRLYSELKGVESRAEYLKRKISEIEPGSESNLL